MLNIIYQIIVIYFIDSFFITCHNALKKKKPKNWRRKHRNYGNHSYHTGSVLEVHTHTRAHSHTVRTICRHPVSWKNWVNGPHVCHNHDPTPLQKTALTAHYQHFCIYIQWSLSYHGSSVPRRIYLPFTNFPDTVINPP